MFTWLIGQLYAEALSRYNVVGKLLPFKNIYYLLQNISLISFDCDITFDIVLSSDLPLRQHSLLKLTCCKLAIINVINNHRLNKTFSRSEGVAKTNHHGLISSEFQTGNLLTILQKWQCEVWSWFDKQLILAVSDVGINALWKTKSKWIIS